MIISFSNNIGQRMIHRLSHITDIPDPGSREFSIQTNRATTDIFITHKNGAFFAYKNSCPHTGASLNWQEDQFLDLDQAFIQCSVHGALFEIESGYCIAGPCSGSSLEALNLSVQDDVLVLNL